MFNSLFWNYDGCKANFYYVFLGNGKPAVESLLAKYTGCLRTFIENNNNHHHHQQHSQRVEHLLGQLPEVQAAATLVLDSKMFYIPFLLNTSITS